MSALKQTIAKQRQHDKEKAVKIGYVAISWLVTTYLGAHVLAAHLLGRWPA